MFSCFFFIEFWTISQSNYDDFPAWMRCPNVPAWYIASLVPCWLLFPITLPFFRSCLKFPKAWPLLPMLILLAFASYAPVSVRPPIAPPHAAKRPGPRSRPPPCRVSEASSAPLPLRRERARSPRPCLDPARHPIRRRR